MFRLQKCVSRRVLHRHNSHVGLHFSLEPILFVRICMRYTSSILAVRQPNKNRGKATYFGLRNWKAHVKVTKYDSLVRQRPKFNGVESESLCPGSMTVQIGLSLTLNEKQSR